MLLLKNWAAPPSKEAEQSPYAFRLCLWVTTPLVCFGSPVLRFGKALSRLRTEHAASVKKAARKALKHNLKTYQTIPKNVRANPRWIKHADLKPVLEFLS